jgi:hypothetical protein
MLECKDTKPQSHARTDTPYRTMLRVQRHRRDLLLRCYSQTIQFAVVARKVEWMGHAAAAPDVAANHQRGQ